MGNDHDSITYLQGLVAELKQKLQRQASSHGMYITQTVEPKIAELEAQVAGLFEARRDTARDHQEEARCWQVERTKLEKERDEFAANRLNWKTLANEKGAEVKALSEAMTAMANLNGKTIRELEQTNIKLREALMNCRMERDDAEGVKFIVDEVLAT